MEISTVPSNQGNNLDKTFVPSYNEHDLGEIEIDERRRRIPHAPLKNPSGLKWWDAIEATVPNEAEKGDVWNDKGHREHDHEEEQSEHENVEGCGCGDCESDISSLSTDSFREMTQERWNHLNMTWKKMKEDPEETKRMTMDTEKEWDLFNSTWIKGIKKDGMETVEKVVVTPDIPFLEDDKNQIAAPVIIRKRKANEDLEANQSKSLRMLPSSIEKPSNEVPLKVSPQFTLLDQYGKQLGGPSSSYGETGCRHALVGIKTLLQDEDVTMEDVMDSGIFPSITQVLMRKGLEVTKVEVLKTLLTCWSKASYTIKTIIMEELGDVVVQRLALEGGEEVGWLAALLVTKIELYIKKTNEGSN